MVDEQGRESGHPEHQTRAFPGRQEGKVYARCLCGWETEEGSGTSVLRQREKHMKGYLDGK